MQSLRMSGLATVHVGLSDAIAAYYEEAAGVCLERHHASPVEIAIECGEDRTSASAAWGPVTDRQRAAWANEIDATEAGAYAVVLSAVECQRGLLAVRRAETGSGADYYIGPPGAGRDDLEGCYRLEVSGTDRGQDSELQRRLAQKQQQAANGNGSLPAIAGVVGFAALRVLLADVAEP